MSINVDFPADDFIEGTRFSMQMGAPPALEDRAKFVFKPSGARTYWKGGVQVDESTVVLDVDGNPLDLDVEVRTDQPKIVQQRKYEALTPLLVDCAIEVEDIRPEELPTGQNFRPTKLTVTVLDVDHLKIEGCREVVMGTDRYLFSHTLPGLGMFSVGIFQLIFYALDES